MPVEFSVAAYRFGHSQIRGRYRVNTLVGGPPTGGPLPTFKPGSVDVDPLGHFGGFRTAGQPLGRDEAHRRCERVSRLIVKMRATASWSRFLVLAVTASPATAIAS